MINKTEKIIIIGGGPAGLAAAIYAARDGLNPLVFAGSLPGGQPMLTSVVENYPGHEKILGPDLVRTMRKQAISFGARFVDKNVIKVDFSKRPFNIFISEPNSGSTPCFSTASPSLKRGPRRLSQNRCLHPYFTKSVIITTGAKALWLNLPSEQRLIGKGVSACANCDGFFFRDKTVAVVGGGDTALEEALSLTKYAKKVYVIHRRDHFRASKAMQDKVFANPKIEVVWNAVATEVLGKNRVEGIRLESVEISPRHFGRDQSESVKSVLTDSTDSNITQPIPTGRLLKVDGLFIAIGYKPDTDLFEGQVEMDKNGYIITKGYMTSVKGVFAGGDCIDPNYKQLATAIGSGVAAAVEADKWLESVRIG